MWNSIRILLTLLTVALTWNFVRSLDVIDVIANNNATSLNARAALTQGIPFVDSAANTIKIAAGAQSVVSDVSPTVYTERAVSVLYRGEALLVLDTVNLTLSSHYNGLSSVLAGVPFISASFDGLTGQSTLYSPVAMDYDEESDVLYILDGCSLRAFSFSDKMLRTILGTPVSCGGPFYQPASISVIPNAAGNPHLAIVDKAYSSVLLYDTTTNTMATIRHTFSSLTSAAGNSLDSIYVSTSRALYRVNITESTDHVELVTGSETDSTSAIVISSGVNARFKSLSALSIDRTTGIVYGVESSVPCIISIEQVPECNDTLLVHDSSLSLLAPNVTFQASGIWFMVLIEDNLIPFRTYTASIGSQAESCSFSSTHFSPYWRKPYIDRTTCKRYISGVVPLDALSANCVQSNRTTTAAADGSIRHDIHFSFTFGVTVAVKAEIHEALQPIESLTTYSYPVKISAPYLMGFTNVNATGNVQSVFLEIPAPFAMRGFFAGSSLDDINLIAYINLVALVPLEQDVTGIRVTETLFGRNVTYLPFSYSTSPTARIAFITLRVDLQENECHFSGSYNAELRVYNVYSGSETTQSIVVSVTSENICEVQETIARATADLWITNSSAVFKLGDSIGCGLSLTSQHSDFDAEIIAVRHFAICAEAVTNDICVMDSPIEIPGKYSLFSSIQNIDTGGISASFLKENATAASLSAYLPPTMLPTGTQSGLSYKAGISIDVEVTYNKPITRQILSNRRQRRITVQADVFRVTTAAESKDVSSQSETFVLEHGGGDGGGGDPEPDPIPHPTNDSSPTPAPSSHSNVTESSTSPQRSAVTQLYWPMAITFLAALLLLSM